MDAAKGDEQFFLLLSNQNILFVQLYSKQIEKSYQKSEILLQY